MINKMKISEKCYLKNKRDNLDYLIEFTHLNGEQVSYLKEIGRKGKPVKINIEIEEKILDDDEERYLKSVVRPFGDKVIYIKKQKLFSNTCYIEILIESSIGHNSERIDLPCFLEKTMYKGMELNKEYTLKELGL